MAHRSIARGVETHVTADNLISAETGGSCIAYKADASSPPATITPRDADRLRRSAAAAAVGRKRISHKCKIERGGGGVDSVVDKRRIKESQASVGDAG